MSKKNVLTRGEKIQGTNYSYTIERVLGSGAYGITYLATTMVPVNGDFGVVNMEVCVTLKEFFMEGQMHREGNIVERDVNDKTVDTFARCFFLEADKVASLLHPNIVKVLEVFVANNTCYYAMEYISGGTLQAYILKKGGLPEQEALKFINQLGSALAYMHDHMMLHLDVKPTNLMLTAEGNLKIIDYGLSVQFEQNGTPESGDGIGYGTPGYAPLEQGALDETFEFEPKLDVYALGATYYKMLTAITPPPAVTVLNGGFDSMPLVSKNVSQQSIDAIKAAMKPLARDRVATVNEFLAMLPKMSADDEQKSSHKKTKWWKWAVFIVTALAVFALCVALRVLL